MPTKPTRRLVEGAMIAALYVALTLFSRLLGIADGAVHFRLSEALTVLPVFTPAAVPGLTIGCLLANLGSPYGVADILSGTAATLLAALCTRALRGVTVRRIAVLAPVPPVIFNALIVGVVVTIMNEAGQLIPSAFSFAAFSGSALFVALGEIVVCAGLGLPLLWMLQKGELASRIFGGQDALPYSQRR